jgi:hypothetical protein
MKKKVTFEVSAEYIDWKDMLEKLNETVEETCKEVYSLDINYSEDREC